MTLSPRDRLLATASDIFYREGINGVGVDRILSEAGVTRATMYRHFDGKEALVVAYLEREDLALREMFAQAGQSGFREDELLGAVIDGIAMDIANRHTRGCPFINAAAEFPSPNSSVREVVSRHRAWFRETLEHIAKAAGLKDPDSVAASLVLLRDAALVGAYLDGAESVQRSFKDSAAAILGRGL